MPYELRNSKATSFFNWLFQVAFGSPGADTHIQTHRQTQTHTEIQIQRQTHRHTGTHTHRQTHARTRTHTHKYTNKWGLYNTWTLDWIGPWTGLWTGPWTHSSLGSNQLISLKYHCLADLLSFLIQDVPHLSNLYNKHLMKSFHGADTDDYLNRFYLASSYSRQ